MMEEEEQTVGTASMISTSGGHTNAHNASSDGNDFEVMNDHINSGGETENAMGHKVEGSNGYSTNNSYTSSYTSSYIQSVTINSITDAVGNVGLDDNITTQNLPESCNSGYHGTNNINIGLDDSRSGSGSGSGAGSSSGGSGSETVNISLQRSPTLNGIK